MEYTTQKELYLHLIPAFNVKKRLLQLSNYKNITNIDIWKYLSIHKWKSSIDLTLADIVNDIISVDIYDVLKYKEEDEHEK